MIHWPVAIRAQNNYSVQLHALKAPARRWIGWQLLGVGCRMSRRLG